LRAAVAAQLAATPTQTSAPGALPAPAGTEGAAGFAPARAERLEPIASEPMPMQDAPVAAADAEAVPQEDSPVTPATKILALRLIATTPRFSGAHLRTALEAEGLAFGKYQIFHRISAEGEVLFSVASMLEPGTFDLEQMFHEQYPGIALFAQLPAVLDGLTVLSELIAAARRLQSSLGGVLQDEQGTPLLAFRIEQLRREVRDFEDAVRQSRPRSER